MNAAAAAVMNLHKENSYNRRGFSSKYRNLCVDILWRNMEYMYPMMSGYQSKRYIYY